MLAKFVPQAKVIEYHARRVTGLTSIFVRMDVAPNTSFFVFVFSFPSTIPEPKLFALYELITTLNIQNYYEERY